MYLAFNKSSIVTGNTKKWPWLFYLGGVQLFSSYQLVLVLCQILRTKRIRHDAFCAPTFWYKKYSRNSWRTEQLRVELSSLHKTWYVMHNWAQNEHNAMHQKLLQKSQHVVQTWSQVQRYRRCANPFNWTRARTAFEMWPIVPNCPMKFSMQGIVGQPYCPVLFIC